VNEFLEQDISDEAEFQQHTNKMPLWTNTDRKRFKRMQKNSQKINAVLHDSLTHDSLTPRFIDTTIHWNTKNVYFINQDENIFAKN
jgi:hypothetical protein